MKILENVYHEILHCFPYVPPEAGGILGCNIDGEIIAFNFDPGKPNLDRAIYTPNTQELNHQICLWASEGIQFCGIVHSHPPGQESLSKPDIEFIQQIISVMPSDLQHLFFPVVFPQQKMIGFRADRHNQIMIREENIEII